MKKIFGLLILCMAFALTSCEHPGAPASIIGHWRVLGDHWTATFKEDGELYISSTKYDTGLPFHYTATADSLYISTIHYAEDGQEIYGTPYVCPYSFRGNPTLVIDGFNYVYEKPLGTITQNYVEKKQVVLTKVPQIR